MDGPGLIGEDGLVVEEEFSFHAPCLGAALTARRKRRFSAGVLSWLECVVVSIESSPTKLSRPQPIAAVIFGVTSRMAVQTAQKNGFFEVLSG